MPARLAPIDAVGIHMILAYNEVYRRFPRLEAQAYPRTAALFAVRACETRRKLTPESFVRLEHVLMTWYDGRYADSSNRLRTATLEEISADPGYYDPALTLSLLVCQRDWVDFPGNRSAARMGIRLSEQRGNRSAKGEIDPELSNLHLTDADIEDLLRVMTEQDPGQRLFYVTKAKKYRLGAHEVRDAVDRNVGAVEPVHEKGRGRRLPLELLRDRAAAGGAPEQRDGAADELKAARVLLRDLEARTRPGSMDSIALDYISQRLHQQQELSVRAYARERGVNHETLRRHVAAIRARVRGGLGPK